MTGLAREEISCQIKLTRSEGEMGCNGLFGVWLMDGVLRRILRAIAIKMLGSDGPAG